MILKFFARAHHYVEAPGMVVAAGRNLQGRPVAEPTCVMYFGKPGQAEPPATTALIAACARGELWAGDDLTAKACGVEYTPVHFVADDGGTRWESVS
jgi:hypothetical protein